ncbi:hypothetical protein BUALT_Bualt13G0048400 [Buddleja alternifolia]|uniref:Uncharacterized protein n=1 Tax=Buddleja alternifolia TaxID=168488 RepID=A0AAV6WRI7_9LAMI|nr:hypothetical protein BUALT_Bualt13G0048400 [Buddleja alternifolia]
MSQTKQQLRVFKLIFYGFILGFDCTIFVQQLWQFFSSSVGSSKNICALAYFMLIKKY